jgi:AraC-like DNA-binding protein
MIWGLRVDLADLIARHTHREGVHVSRIPRLDLVRISGPTGPVHSMHEKAVVFVAQGSKRVVIGANIFTNAADQFLVVSAEVPVIGEVTDATPAEPYLCMRLHLNAAVLRELIIEAELEDEVAHELSLGLALGTVTPELLAAATRLVALLDAPRDIRVLAPMAEREILYRLLVSDQAGRLLQIARPRSELSQVNKAIDFIKRNFDKALRMSDVAQRAGMSPSALNQHFRAATAMSPLQYQKHVRLQTARRLIFTESVDAASAAHRVGYESPSQFSREYRRLFGAPPIRDLAMHAVLPAGAMRRTD